MHLKFGQQNQNDEHQTKEKFLKSQ